MKHWMSSSLKNPPRVHEPFSNHRETFSGSLKLDEMMIGGLLNLEMYYRCLMANFSNSSDTKRTTKMYLFFFKSTDQSERFLARLRDKKPAMHYSTWFNVIRDGAEVAESFKDACVLKGFLGQSLLGEEREGKKRQIPSGAPLCLSRVSEWKGRGWRWGWIMQVRVLLFGEMPAAAQGSAQETLWNIDSPL